MTSWSLEMSSLTPDAVGRLSLDVLSLDATYRRLREDGHGGWGGAKFRSRLEGWDREISAWLSDSRVPPSGARLLELGCGNGAIAALFAERGYEIAGIDISEVALAWARDDFARRQLRGEFHFADLAEGIKPFADESFDVVVDGNCLHCILGPKRASALASVRRVVAPGGVYLVSSMCGDPRSLEACEGFDPDDRFLRQHGEPYRYLPTCDALVSELTSAGFKILKKRVQENEWWDHLWLLASPSTYSHR